jgi:Ca2+-binding RTX toxin-like protein
MWDSLEARRLLSVAMENGRLHIVGTERDDRIIVQISGGGPVLAPSVPKPATLAVTINGAAKKFALADIKSVFIEGLGGDDRVVYGRDYVNRGEAFLDGPGDPDALISGGNGDDTIIGGGASDVLVGGSGNDLLLGRGGADRLEGGDGNDTLQGGDDADDLRGGRGIDAVDYSDRSLAVRVTLDDINDDGPKVEFGSIFYGGRFDREGDNAHSDIEQIWGSNGNDTLTGNNGPNTILGGGGNDRLYGLAGQDLLSGGRGNDTLTGGGGTEKRGDYYAGGDGADVAADFLVGKSFIARDVESGVFRGYLRTDIAAIGGETTGYMLAASTSHLLSGYDVSISDTLRSQAQALAGKFVTIQGDFTTKTWTESGVQNLIVATAISADAQL